MRARSERANASPTGTDDAGRPHAPASWFAVTISSSLRKHAQALHRDELSGVSLCDLQTSLAHIHDRAFGRKIAHGMVVTFGSGTAQIHIRDTDLRPILESIRTYSNTISDCIARYQGISGVTPSKSGLRVFSLVLQKVLGSDSESRQSLRAVCEEALAIDLVAPDDKEWRREVVVPIEGFPCKMTVSLAPISMFARALVNTINTDVPTADRKNRYAYSLTMEPEHFTESLALRTLKSLGRQAVAVATLISPMIAAEYAIGNGALSSFLPAISNDATLLSRGLADLVHLFTLGAVGTATYLAYHAYNSFRLLRRE